MYLSHKAEVRSQVMELTTLSLDLQREMAKVKSNIRRYEEVKPKLTKKNEIKFVNDSITEQKELLANMMEAYNSSMDRIKNLNFQIRPAGFLLYKPTSTY